MTLNELSHVDDPTTSSIAAVKLNPNDTLRIKFAIVALLAEKPRTADELIQQYRARAERERWPLISDLHNVKRRLSTMHTKHRVIAPTGEHRTGDYGRPVTVWELTMVPDAARVAIAMT